MEDHRHQVKNGNGRSGGLSGGVGPEGLIGGLGDLVGLLSRMVETERAGPEERGEYEDMRAIYGYSVRMGVGSLPRLEYFGNIHHTDRGPIVSEVRLPIADVMDEGDLLRVVVELPGVRKIDIRVRVSTGNLSLRARAGHRRYAGEISLPAEVVEEPVSASYLDGMLEIVLRKG